MESLLVFLGLGGVLIVAIIAIVVAFGNKKALKETEKRSAKQVADRVWENPVMEELRKDLRTAIDGLNYYQNETEKWYRRYESEVIAHANTQIQFNDRLRKVELEMKSLRTIVTKMDGKQIVRDEVGKIVDIKKFA